MPETRLSEQTTFQTLSVRPFSWEVINGKGSSTTTILSWCRSRDPDPNWYLLRFNFPVYFYLELPLFIGPVVWDWTQDHVSTIFHWLRHKFGELGPIGYEFEFRRKLYFYQGNKTYPMMRLEFNNIENMNEITRYLRYPRYVSYQTYNNWIKLSKFPLQFKIWEDKISPIRKMLTLQDCSFTDWFTVTCRVVPDVERISKPKDHSREYIVDNWHTLCKISAENCHGWFTRPNILSYDIEAYSSNHKAFPFAHNSTDVPYIITIIFQQFDRPETRKRFTIVFTADPLAVHYLRTTREGEVIHVTTEIELIKRFCNLVNELDPDTIIGYNILGFDYPYLDARLKRRMLNWENVSRLRNNQPILVTGRWKSEAYGHVEINNLEIAGRLNIDLFPIVKRDYKLLKYDLDTVSRTFINRGKHDVKAQRQFEIKENTDTALSLISLDMRRDTNLDAYQGLTISPPPDPECRNSSTEENEYNEEQCERVLRKLHSLSSAKGQTRAEMIKKITYERRLKLLEYAMREMNRMLDYGLEDSENVMDLFHRLNIWHSLNELSNIEGITITDLFTRGQQIRTVSQVYDSCVKSNITMTREDTPDVPYRGAIVQHPIPGIYWNIICLDFASLYPTIMIAYNLCWTTFVPQDMWSIVPLEHCHEFEWTDEIEEKEGEDKGKISTYHHNYRVIKAEHQKGLLPMLLERLISERRKVNKDLIPAATDDTERTILDRRQWGLKVSANSKYGILGVGKGKGKLALMALAAIVTYVGRNGITKAAEKAKEVYNAKLVYGDTDSAMLDCGIENAKDCIRIGKDMSGVISRDFPPPMKLEFEKAMRVMLCITAKKYTAILMDEEGYPKIYSPAVLGQHVALFDSQGRRFDSYDQAEQAFTHGQLVFDRYQNSVDITAPKDQKRRDTFVWANILRYCELYDENGVAHYDMTDQLHSCPIWYTKDRKYAVDAKLFLIKGIVLARRDNFIFQRTVYSSLLTTIMVKGLLIDKTWRDNITFLKQQIEHLIELSRTSSAVTVRFDSGWLRGELDRICKHLHRGTAIVIDSILKLITGLTGSVEGKNGAVSWTELTYVRTLGAQYKSDTYFMKLFGDLLRAHGQLVQAGDRIEHLVVKCESDKLGNKLRTPEMYLEALSGPKPERPDAGYYVGSLKSGIDQLIEIGFIDELDLLDKYYTYLGRAPHESKRSESRVVRSRLDGELVKHTMKWLAIREDLIRSIPQHEAVLRDRWNQRNSITITILT